MSDYERQRERHLARALTLAPGLIDRLDWSADQLAVHRTERLRELVGYAIGSSPWHRERLAGADLARLDEDTLRELPPMTKTDLMEHYDKIVTDGRVTLTRVNAHLETVSAPSYLLDRYTAITSGGSSGQRGVFVYDWDGWATFWVGLFRYLLRAKWTDPELASRPVVWGWVMAAHFTHATAALSRTFASSDSVNLRFPVTLPTERIVAGLNEAQPDILVGYASALHVLSAEAEARRLRIAPRTVLSSAEPLLPEIRAAAERAWNVRVGNVWGTSEGGGTAIPCDHASSHLGEDLMIVEPVDEHGRPVAPGEPSAKVYLTNLYNHAIPLIRYEIDDEITVLRQPCPCGSAMQCIGDIQGRLDDAFEYAGRRVHPHVFRSALAQHAGIVEYQVHQTPHGADIAIRRHGPVDLDQLRRELAEALHRTGLESPKITLEIVAQLKRDDGPGKLKRFVPLANTDSRRTSRQTLAATHT
jgi:phenylacetate-coenzyme A ligase PaaK-like adenylate-forming protein